MMYCPFTDKVCMMHSSEDKQCTFEILPHTKDKPMSQKECTLKYAALLYIKKIRPDMEF